MDNTNPQYKFNAPAYGIKKLSPKVRMAIRMLENGAARTVKEAAIAAGIAPTYLSQLRSSAPAREYMDELQRKIDERAIDMNVLMERLSYEAVGRIRNLMRNSESEAIVLKASQDLLDRNPATSKTQRHQIEAVSISGKDAKALAEALVAGRAIKTEFAEAAQGNYDKTAFTLPEKTSDV